MPLNAFSDTRKFSVIMEHGWGLPYDYYFYDGMDTCSELPKNLYDNGEMYNTVRFRFDGNGGYEGIKNNTGIRPRRIGWLEM